MHAMRVAVQERQRGAAVWRPAFSILIDRTNARPFWQQMRAEARRWRGQVEFAILWKGRRYSVTSRDFV
jgi:hypothetical protein